MFFNRSYLKSVEFVLVDSFLIWVENACCFWRRSFSHHPYLNSVWKVLKTVFIDIILITHNDAHSFPCHISKSFQVQHFRHFLSYHFLFQHQNICRPSFQVPSLIHTVFRFLSPPHSVFLHLINPLMDFSWTWWTLRFLCAGWYTAALKMGAFRLTSVV